MGDFSFITLKSRSIHYRCLYRDPKHLFHVQTPLPHFLFLVHIIVLSYPSPQFETFTAHQQPTHTPAIYPSAGGRLQLLSPHLHR